MNTYYIVGESGEIFKTDSKEYAERMSDEQCAISIDPSKNEACIEGSWIKISDFVAENWLEDEDEDEEEGGYN